LQSDSNSQALISFVEPTSNLLIAQASMMPDSKLAIIRVAAPRYQLGDRTHEIDLESIEGQLLLHLPATESIPTKITVIQDGARVIISGSGELLFEFSEANSSVLINKGEVKIVDVSGDTLELESGDQVALSSGRIIGSRIQITRLVNNGDFADSLRVGWRSVNDGQPEGLVSVTTIQSRHALLIDRSKENWPGLVLDHGETGFRQVLNRDVSDFRTLELNLTFRIEEQSLSTCGVAGSECPLMVRVSYLDPTGIERVFIHGFYANHDPGRGYPLLCDTCRSVHDRLSLSTWYSYTINLLSVLPEEQRPVILRELSFYSSGHAYKVYVSGINITAER
jgi:hypothetical protein